MHGLKVWSDHGGVKTCFHSLRFVSTSKFILVSPSLYGWAAKQRENEKRQTRNSSGSETVSPEGQRTRDVSNKKIESSTDNDGKNHTAALNLSELNYYLANATSTRKTVYDSLDGKLNGELEKVKRPETALNSV